MQQAKEKIKIGKIDAVIDGSRLSLVSRHNSTNKIASIERDDDYNVSCQQLRAILLQKKISDVDLRSNELVKLSPSRLVKLAQVFDGTVVECLSLGENGVNGLYCLWIAKFVNALKNTQVTYLDLSRNNLQKITVSEVQQLAAGLKDKLIKGLGLSFNNLGQEPEKLAIIIKELKAIGISLLILSENSLSSLSEAQMAHTFSALRDSQITDLRLSSNELGSRNLSALPILATKLQGSGVAKLDLSYNQLKGLEAEGLVRFIQELKGTAIKSLDISNNDLGELPAQVLIAVAKELANTEIEEIDLSGNGLENFSAAQLRDLAKALATSCVRLTGDYRELAGLLCQQVQSLSEPLVYGGEPETLLINEDYLAWLVKSLEQTATPASLMTAGLLLAGLIPMAEDKTPSFVPADEQAYEEKRLHDAITFIEKAGQSVEYNAMAFAYLFEIRAVHGEHYPSVGERLSCYPLQKNGATTMHFRKTETTAPIPRFLFWEKRSSSAEAETAQRPGQQLPEAVTRETTACLQQGGTK